MYAITKLAVHWGTLVVNAKVFAKALQEAASGAFVSGSSQAAKAAQVLGIGLIPANIIAEFRKSEKGGYSAAAAAVKVHVDTCMHSATCSA